MTTLRSVRAGPLQRGSAFYAVFWLAGGLWEPFLSVHFAARGLSGREIGLLWALLPLATLLLAPLAARAADRRRRRVRLLALTLALAAPAMLLLGAPRAFGTILPAMLLLALLRGPAEPLADAVVARMAATHDVAYGRMRLWGSLVFALTALLAGRVWQTTGYGLMFPAAALALLFAAAAAAMLDEPPPEPASRSPAPPIPSAPPAPVTPDGAAASGALPPPRRPFDLPPALGTLLVASFLVGAAMGIGGAFGGVYMDDLGGGAFLVGALFAVAALAELPTMHFADALLRRLGEVGALSAGYLLVALGLGGYAFVTAPGPLLVLAAVKGLGFGLFFVATVHLVDARAPAARVATLQSLVLGVAAFGLARLVAAPLGGLVYDAVAPAAPFALGGALCLAATLLVLLRRGRFAAPPERNDEGSDDAAAA